MLNYIQENENVQDSAINTMLKDTASAYKTKSKKAEGSSFSAIMNNLSSKTQKAQTNFVDRVAKTNTSSINRKAFDNKTASNKSDYAKPDDNAKNVSAHDSLNAPKKADKKEKYSKNADRKDNKKNAQDNAIKADNKAQKQENNVSLEDSKNIESAQTAQSNQTVQKTQGNETTETANQNQNNFQLIQKLSDINDNSSVEPSPVFLNEETNENALTEIKSDDVIANIAATLIPNQESNGQNNKDTLLDKVSEEIVNADNSDNLIDKITQALDEFNLKKDDEQDIKEAIDKIKEIKSNANTDDFSDVLAAKEEIKEVISDLSSKIENNSLSKTNANNDFNFGTEEKTLISADYSLDFKKPEMEIKPENTQDIENEAKISQKPINGNIEDLKANEEALEFNDIELNNVQDKSDKNISQSVIATNENDFEVQEYNSDVVEYDDEADVEVDFKKEDVKLKDKIALNSENTVSLTENDTKELVDLIKENNSNVEIEETNLALNVQNIEPKETTVTDKQPIIENPNENLISRTKLEDNGLSDNSNQDYNQNSKENDNNYKLAENKVNFGDKLNVKNEQETESFDIEANETAEDIEITEDNVEKTKLYARVTQDSKTNDTEKVELNQENLEKLAFEQDKLDEMLVSMSKQTINTSALTVADEVAKIAMNEDTSITSPVNITYNGSEDSILLKNIQSVRPQESIFNQLQSKLDTNNILNQITEKFEQIKDTLNQKFTMVLRPNDLGRLSIELTNGLKGLITNIVVQNEHVRNFIEKNINTLRNQLASAGVNVNQIQIKTAGTGETNTYFGNQNQEQGQNQEQSGQNLAQNQNQQQEQTKKQFKSNESLIASLSNFDTSFADDFSNVLNKTISYELS